MCANSISICAISYSMYAKYKILIQFSSGFICHLGAKNYTTGDIGMQQSCNVDKLIESSQICFSRKGITRACLNCDFSNLQVVQNVGLLFVR